MSEMTREQVLDSHQDIREAYESIMLCEHLDELAAHDAYQRQRIAELEAEVARLKEQAKGPHSGYRIL